MADTCSHKASVDPTSASTEASLRKAKRLDSDGFYVDSKTFFMLDTFDLHTTISMHDAGGLYATSSHKCTNPGRKMPHS